MRLRSIHNISMHSSEMRGAERSNGNSVPCSHIDREAQRRGKVAEPKTHDGNTVRRDSFGGDDPIRQLLKSFKKQYIVPLST